MIMQVKYRYETYWNDSGWCNNVKGGGEFSSENRKDGLRVYGKLTWKGNEKGEISLRRFKGLFRSCTSPHHHIQILT